MTEEEKCIYMAGFFDGEGYIGLLKRIRGKYIEHFIQISIGQKDGAIMDWVVENFGGNLYLVKRDGSYQWLASNKVAHSVLKRITPYLKYKKPQGEMAIDFLENKKKMDAAELARREELHIRLKTEKHVFTKSLLYRAGSTTKRIDIRKDDVIV